MTRLLLLAATVCAFVVPVVAFAAGSADVTVDKTDQADPVPLGGNITYNLAVKNNGPDASTGAAVSDVIPPGTTFVSATPPAGAGTCSESGGTVDCTLGPIASGAAVNIALVVTPTAAGSFTNKVVVRGRDSDPNLNNNQDEETTTVVACTKSGGPGADRLIGTSGPDVLCGRGGNDTMSGADGDDLLFGEGANDTMNGGNGLDHLDGGVGADRLEGFNGNDTLIGGLGNDNLFGQNGDDRLEGREGNDSLAGGANFDTCIQGPGTGPLVGCEA